MNDITSEATLEKLKNVISHSQLKELDLSFNNIGNAGAKVMALAIHQISSLESLNLTHCQITAPGAIPIFQTLAKNSRLRQLILDKNFLEGKRLRILKEFMGSNSGLTLLSLNLCRLCEEGASYLARGLGFNRNLKTLLLSGNAMKDLGLAAISDAVSKSSLPLVHLDVSNNIITDESAIPFAHAMTSNRYLEMVNMKGNQIGPEGGNALREAIGDHDSLVKFNLESNAVAVRDVEEIERHLRRNRDAKVKERMPRYRGELETLIKTRKLVELSDTLT